MSKKTLNLSELYKEGTGGVVLLQSHAGHGRSRYAQHLLYEERKQGLNTLFLSSDLASVHANAMQISKHMYMLNPATALSDSEIVNQRYDLHQATDLQNAMLDASKQGFGQFFAECVEELSIDNLESTLEDIWDGGQQFDIVVVDGIHLPMGVYTLNEVLTKLDQLSKTFKGVGFKGVITLQLAKHADPENVLAYNRDTSNPSTEANYYAITLNKVGDSLSVHQKYLTGNDVENKKEVLDTNFKFCSFSIK